jgi:hypothetical protein
VTKVVENKKFESRQIRDKPALVEGLEFRRCEFMFSSLAATSDVRKRATVRKVQVVDCTAEACRIGGAILDEVVVDRLRTNGIFRVSASAFRHVTLRGSIDEILIHPTIWPGPATSAQQRAFDEANAAFYSEVDWALDITQAEFGAAEIQGVPARLVRRDPESQVVVRLEKALAREWRGLGLEDTPWPGMIQFLIDDGYPDKILIAPKRHPNYQRLRESLMTLKESGVAE